MKISILAVCLTLLTSLAFADDWPQHLGPNRNGISAEQGLIADIPDSGLNVLWQVSGGVGMSGVAVADGTAITIVQKENKQVVIALDAKTGESKWEVGVAPEFKNSMGNGPRAFPCIHKGNVIVFTGQGNLISLKLADGSTNWWIETVKVFGGQVADYGMACSPLIVGDTVAVTTGHKDGSVLAAYNLDDGKEAWHLSWPDAIGYSSPSLLTLADKEQIVVYTGTNVRGVDTTGKSLWSYEYVTPFDCNIVTPQLVGKDLFFSSGENHGSVLLSVSKGKDSYKLTEKWSSQGPSSVLRNEWQTSVLIDGYLYGWDNVGGAGPITHLKCVNATTGELAWEELRFGKGNFTAADGKLFLNMMSGELVVIEANSKEYVELSRQKVHRGSRQAPTLSNGILYLRDDATITALSVSK